ncbi:hypothetical protein CBR_g45944 [Chara braunii]|uniref:Uncharacterized protein n=1 Tax=Chara braunii TaxID=69332 RepID=A0A388LZN7_CHABU|nr:hypothetical protein CBR_g45944 [Chara braunii]|eukprot:GBG87788.1 hypothetical protein CBR_g45944 [Chara braunii]
MSEFVQAEKAKKAEEERLRRGAEEEEQRREAKKLDREKKARKKIEKQRKNEERVAEIDKKVQLQVAIKTGEFFDRMEANLGPVLALGQIAKGKKQVVYVSDEGLSSGHGSGGSATKEIQTKTRRLVISEKRKRGAELVLENSPPMLTPAKRTLRVKKKKTSGGVLRVTRSKAKMKTKVSPYTAKGKSPGQQGTVAKLRFLNQVMEELHNMDAQQLQAACKSEGIAYNGKVDAIFDIASHRTRKAFGEVEPVVLADKMAKSEDLPATVEDVDQESEV